MMNIARYETADETAPNPFNSVLPVEANTKMTQLNLKKVMERIQNKDEEEKKEAAKSLHPNGLDIPIKTFK